MSARSTPLRKYNNASPQYDSPVSTSTTAYPDPSSSRRPTRTGSSISALPLLPHDSFRRASHLISRKESQTTISGSSTPASRRRKQASKEDKVGERDWANMEPDEVFRRLPVNEVRRVEAKMRGEALNKQSELRSMVGTRYRDLLTSGTQITALRSASIRLSDSLKIIGQSCSDTNTTLENGENDSMDHVDVEDVMNMLPVAAHMKLLLDAPEALYVYLSHHAYLNAAFLWLVTRVIKEGLSSMPEEASAPYMSLLQKQWETLLPFRNQIVQRATLALRVQEKADSRNMAETILAIILLDNLPLSEALDLFLSQRTKALRTILAHPSEPSTTATHLAPKTVTRGRRRTSSTARRGIGEQLKIESVLREAIESLLDTVTVVGVIFGKRSRQPDSLIEEMIRLVQTGEPVQSVPQMAPMRRTSHERRSSRLASMSLPLPPVDLSHRGPPVSTRRILQPLPSSQILLRHLPSTVLGFTPFISPSARPLLSEKVPTWQSSNVTMLRQALPFWLEDLRSVSDVWAIRAKLAVTLADGDFERDIAQALESEWSVRIKDIWSEKLGDLLELAESNVREAGEKIRREGGESDTNPEVFTFSEMSFPPVPTSTLALPLGTTSFASFLSTVRKRATFRTPLLDACLVALEDLATDLKVDMQGLPQTLYRDYQEKVSATLKVFVAALQKILDSMGPQRGDGRHGIEAELFVGRVAIYLARSSTFLQDVAGSLDVQLESVQSALIDIHASSTIRWRQDRVAEAIELLAPLFDSHRGPREVQVSWQGPMPTSPSAYIMISLQSLVVSSRSLGIPPGVSVPTIQESVEAFVDAARALDGWATQKDESIAQAAVDLGFIGLLQGEEVDKNISVQKMLAKLPVSFPSDFRDRLADILADSLRRTQLLISPLIQHLPTTLLPPPPLASSAETRGDLLRFGPPTTTKTGVGSEFRSPIAVAKPGKRFGLLSITT